MTYFETAYLRHYDRRTVLKDIALLSQLFDLASRRTLSEVEIVEIADVRGRLSAVGADVVALEAIKVMHTGGLNIFASKAPRPTLPVTEPRGN